MAKKKRADLPKGELRKRQIIEKSEELFRKNGYLQTSVSEIIKALGVSSGAVYRHFPTKKAILKAIGRYRFESVQKELRLWLADESLSPAEKMEKLLSQLESGRKMRMMIDRLRLGAVREDREMHETFIQFSLDFLCSDLTTLIEQGVEAGEFQVDHPRAAAVTILLLFSEFVHRAGSLEEIVPWKDLHKTFRYTISAVLHQQSHEDMS